MWLFTLLLLIGTNAYDFDDDDEDQYVYNSENGLEATASSLATRSMHERSLDELYLRTVESYIRTTSMPTTLARTLSPEERRQIRGAINDMMTGHKMGSFTLESVTELQEQLDKMSTPSNITEKNVLRQKLLSPIIKIGHYVPEQTRRSHVIIDGIIFRVNYRKRFRHTNRLDYPIEAYNFQYKDTTFNDEEIECGKLCLKYDHCKVYVVDNGDYVCRVYQWGPRDEKVSIDNGYSYWAYYERVGPVTTTTATETTNTITTILPTTQRPIDIRRLVEIIANLTMNTIESNITELFNATLQKYGIPMCGDTTTTEEPAYDFTNATVVAKCFVCGLETPGIPNNAYCADAFAGDFLPLTPVDPRARGQIARYRKYCRYMDVPGMVANVTQPRSVFGRFTGGCSVRWIDLSGVYTQRACRNRRRAVMGKHYVSKRMAKLEMALQNEDNGCIISPMASLVPFSRGVSLYARFHACVCTGSWCNSAPAQPLHAALIAMTVMALVVS